VGRWSAWAQEELTVWVQQARVQQHLHQLLLPLPPPLLPQQAVQEDQEVDEKSHSQLLLQGKKIPLLRLKGRMYSTPAEAVLLLVLLQYMYSLALYCP
jgi:hypothetical protein